MQTIRLLPLLFLAFFTTGCDNVDPFMATSAAIDAARAITLSEQEVQRIAAATSAQVDEQHRIAPPEHPYARRLQRVLARSTSNRDSRFNCKVYLTDKVNAFAMADGTIRIYAGLMDMLDDDELLFVVGHEMGHVELEHIHEKLRVAYAANATRKAAAAVSGTIGEIARSHLGAFLQQIVTAQFSQHEEREADDYGLAFVRKNNTNPGSAVTALEKLATLGSSHTFLSSHPAPDKRARRIAAQLAGKPLAEEEEGQGWDGTITRILVAAWLLVKKLILWLGSFW
jgi:putative metalloprotease